MDVIFGLEKLIEHTKPAFITLGAFDGVHIAHQKLIRMLVSDATKADGTSVLVTFDPLPRYIVHSNDKGLVLTSTEHKLRILESFGIDLVLIIRFDKEFAAITAGEFLTDIILNRFKHLRKLIVGPRAHFGHNAEGDTAYLCEFGKAKGFDVEVTEEIVIDDAVVSSSVIRKLVRSGELDTAASFLGRRYSLCGKVVSGRRIGRKLGFPTANIDPMNEVHPPSGVYTVEVRLEKIVYPGVLNIGYRPTLSKRDDLEVAIEAHIIGFHGRIYGKPIEVIIHEKLRQELHFADSKELIAQIKQDIEKAKEFLAAKTNVK